MGLISLLANAAILVAVSAHEVSKGRYAEFAPAGSIVPATSRSELSDLQLKEWKRKVLNLMSYPQSRIMEGYPEFETGELIGPGKILHLMSYPQSRIMEGSAGFETGDIDPGYGINIPVEHGRGHGRASTSMETEDQEYAGIKHRFPLLPGRFLGMRQPEEKHPEKILHIMAYPPSRIMEGSAGFETGDIDPGYGINIPVEHGRGHGRPSTSMETEDQEYAGIKHRIPFLPGRILGMRQPEEKHPEYGRLFTMERRYPKNGLSKVTAAKKPVFPPGFDAVEFVRDPRYLTHLQMYPRENSGSGDVHHQLEPQSAPSEGSRYLFAQGQ